MINLKKKMQKKDIDFKFTDTSHFLVILCLRNNLPNNFYSYNSFFGQCLFVNWFPFFMCIEDFLTLQYFVMVFSNSCYYYLFQFNYQHVAPAKKV